MNPLHDPHPLPVIVVAVDVRRLEEPIVARAIAIARRWGDVDVRLVHALIPTRVVLAGNSAISLVDEELHEARQLLVAFAERFLPAGVMFGVEVALGSPADALIALSRKLPAELIVVGAPRPGFRITRSISEQLVRNAPCAVLTVPALPSGSTVARNAA